jgi:serine phosphatase RsbU (regulator of sigma subunit)
MYESLVVRRELERDLRLANQVQKSFLPKRPPQVAGYHFFAHYESAQEVGGDYYDFVRLPDARCAVMVGDVAGKGVPAALLMAKVSSDARFAMLTEKTLADAVSRLNEQLQEAGMLDRFVTLGACLLDSTTHEVSFVNAGHVPPLIYRKAANTFEEAMPRSQAGLPLGVADNITYESVKTTLEPGDSVLLFTDGVTEAKGKNDQDLKMAGALESLKAAPRTPQGFVEHLVATVQEFAKGRKPHDDLTVVAFGRQ